MSSHNAQPGDWIRFYKSGTLVIGIVQYLGHTKYGNPMAHTDIGEVTIADVLEVRHKPVTESTP